MTDEEVLELRNARKYVVKGPTEVLKAKTAMSELKYDLVDGEGRRYEIREVQNIFIPEGFSAVIQLIMPTGKALILSRYNGSAHKHPNHIENEIKEYKCHVHVLTSRYFDSPYKNEGFATVAHNYTSLNGGMLRLIADWNVSGIEIEPTLFD